jgi:hypothetical protein
MCVGVNDLGKVTLKIFCGRCSYADKQKTNVIEIYLVLPGILPALMQTLWFLRLGLFKYNPLLVSQLCPYLRLLDSR